MNKSTIWYERIYKRSESNLLPPTVRFDRIDGSYDDSNKLKPKNPQTHPYFDRLSERHAIREGSDKSAKIANSGEKGLQRVNNWLFHTNKPVDSLDSTRYP